MSGWLRRGGNASMLLDPLGWRVHGVAWPPIWFARKFRPGSLVNRAAYDLGDRIFWWRMRRWMKKWDARSGERG